MNEVFVSLVHFVIFHIWEGNYGREEFKGKKRNYNYNRF